MDVVLRFRCSVKGHDFDVHFRPRDGEQARIVAIEAVRATAPKKPTLRERLTAKFAPTPPATVKELDTDDLDFSRFCCPWCGKGKSAKRGSCYWRCSTCGQLHCLGSIDESQSEHYVTCGFCDGGGTLVKRKHSLMGKEAVSRITHRPDRLIEKK